MNKQELQQAFSNVHASDALKEQVLSAETEPKKYVNGWALVRRAVACAAVLALLLTMFFWPTEVETEDGEIITASGLLSVKAHAIDAEGNATVESVVLEEGIVVPMEYTYDPAISVLSKALGLPFQFSVLAEEYTDQEISFEIYLSGGDFEHLGYLAEFSDYFLGLDDSVDSYDVSKARYLGEHFTIPNNKTIYWRATGHVFDDEKREIQYIELDTDRVFVDVVIRADEHIVGFAVIEICDMGVENRFVYNTRLLKSVSFPQVDGCFQRISEKYVKEQIQLIHDNA